MKNYIGYLVKNKLLNWGKFFFKILPLVISLLALFLSYKSYQNATKQAAKDDKPAWKHEIRITASEPIFQKVIFESNKPEIVLQNLQVFLPSPLDEEVSSHISKNVWNCGYMQMNICEIYSHYNCNMGGYLPGVSASDFPIEKLPIVIKFDYIKDDELRHVYCFYEISFRYFPIGKLKLYSLSFVRELPDATVNSIYDFVNYKNKTEGFYRSEFSGSEKIDSDIYHSDFKPLSTFLKHSANGSIYSDSLEANEVYVPDIIFDSTSVIGTMRYIDSTVDNLDGKKRLNKLRSDFQLLKKWINRKDCCFFFVSEKDMAACMESSVWNDEANYYKWLHLIADIKLDIWQVCNEEPSL